MWSTAAESIPQSLLIIFALLINEYVQKDTLLSSTLLTIPTYLDLNLFPCSLGLDCPISYYQVSLDRLLFSFDPDACSKTRSLYFGSLFYLFLFCYKVTITERFLFLNNNKTNYNETRLAHTACHQISSLRSHRSVLVEPIESCIEKRDEISGEKWRWNWENLFP